MVDQDMSHNLSTESPDLSYLPDNLNSRFKPSSVPRLQLRKMWWQLSLPLLLVPLFVICGKKRATEKPEKKKKEEEKETPKKPKKPEGKKKPRKQEKPEKPKPDSRLGSPFTPSPFDVPPAPRKKKSYSAEDIKPTVPAPAPTPPPPAPEVQLAPSPAPSEEEDHFRCKDYTPETLLLPEIQYLFDLLAQQ